MKIKKPPKAPSPPLELNDEIPVEIQQTIDPEIVHQEDPKQLLHLFKRREIQSPNKSFQDKPPLSLKRELDITINENEMNESNLNFS